MASKKSIQILKSELKGSNFKPFLFFLLFTSVIWLLVQFSKTYTEVLTIPVQFEHAPKDKMIKEDKANLDMRVEQTGFEIAWFKLRKPKISVDISELPTDSIFLNYNIRDHREELDEKIPINLSRIEFLDEDIQIPFEQKEVKTVPIKSKVQIHYASGYSSQEDLQLNPDSVKVSGPASILDTLQYINTKSITKKDIQSDLEEKVKLDDLDGEIELYEDQTEYAIEVERFTERQLNVPVTIINAPDNTNISLYPTSVELTFKVSLERYKQVQSLDFQVVVNYNEILNNQSFLIPRVNRQPNSAKNISISPRKIQYVIKR